jgi:Zn-dependent protease with chaperone function
MSTFSSSGRICLTGLRYEDFVAPADKIALDNLRKLPALESLVRKFNELALDRFFYVQNSAGSVRCSDKQFHTVHGILLDACSILDTPEPELYMVYSPTVSAFTAGIERRFISLHSQLVDSYTNDEILFVLGHEIGHIKSGHLLYQMMAQVLMPLLEVLGKATLGVGQLAGMAVLSAFYEWLRQAEFSADRCGLLACQNPRPALSALMKLGGGSSRFNDEMNLEAFLDQAHQYSEEKGPEGIAKAIMFLLRNWHLTHPQVVHRAKELDAWAKSDEYRAILARGTEG